MIGTAEPITVRANKKTLKDLKMENSKFFVGVPG